MPDEKLDPTLLMHEDQEEEKQNIKDSEEDVTDKGEIVKGMCVVEYENGDVGVFNMPNVPEADNGLHVVKLFNDGLKVVIDMIAELQQAQQDQVQQTDE